MVETLQDSMSMNNRKEETSKLAFFFVSEKEIKHNDNVVKNKVICSFITARLDQIVSQKNPAKWIKALMLEKINLYHPNTKDYFLLPKNWFNSDRGNKENWELALSI